MCCEASVIPFSVAGPGLPSAKKTTIPGNTPTEPRDLTTQPRPGDVTITWSPPAHHSDQVYRYDVSIETTEGDKADKTSLRCRGDKCRYPCDIQNKQLTTWNKATFSPDDRSISVTLQSSPGLRYVVTVKAITSSGRGEANATFTSSETIPSSPVLNLAVTEKSDTTMSLSWEEPEEKNGKILFYNVSMTFIKTSCDDKKVGTSQEFRKTNKTSIRIPDLDPYIQYKFRVTAVNSAGQSDHWSNNVTETTDESRPNAVEKVTVTPFNRSAQVTWVPPCPTNGHIINYTLVLTQIRPATVKRPRTHYTANNYTVIENLKPYTNYEVTVAAYTIKGKSRDSTRHFRTLEAAPGPVVGMKVMQEEDKKKPKSLKVTWKEPTEKNGVITGYTVYIESVKTPLHTETSEVSSTTTSKTFKNVYTKSYYNVTVKAHTKAGEGKIKTKTIFVKAGEQDYDATCAEDKECTDGKCSTSSKCACPDSHYRDTTDNRCIKKLTFGTTCMAATDCADGKCTDNKCACQGTDYHDGTSCKTNEDYTGLIVGVVVAVSAVFTVVAVIFFVLWRRRRASEPKSTTHVGPNEMEMDDTKRSTTHVVRNEMEMDDIKRPIKICEFRKTLLQLHKYSDLGFQNQFEELKKLTYDNKAIRGHRQRAEMCHADALPFDHCRLELKLASKEAKMEFNAGYIAGYNSPKEYITVQGPMLSTTADFWTMVWDQNCTVIIMLADICPGKEHKVSQYWPQRMNEPTNYGDQDVMMTSTTQYDKYSAQNFQITRGVKSMNGMHFYIPGWSDFKTNLSVNQVVKFIRNVRQCASKAGSGPIVIHCSAGVGHTGTFIALDYFLQYVNNHTVDDHLDIFNFVVKMRNNRPQMIQTQTEYIFVFDVLMAVITQTISEDHHEIYEEIRNDGDGHSDNTYPNKCHDMKYVNNHKTKQATSNNDYLQPRQVPPTPPQQQNTYDNSNIGPLTTTSTRTGKSEYEVPDPDCLVQTYDEKKARQREQTIGTRRLQHRLPELKPNGTGTTSGT